MIEDIHIAPRKYRRANCQKCKRKIERLEIRSSVQGSLYMGYLCGKCTKEELEKIPKKLKELNKKLCEFEEMNEKERMEYLKRLDILKELEK